MKRLYRHVIIIVAVLVLGVGKGIYCSAADNDKRVLVVCSHAETSDWATSILNPLTELEKNIPGITFYTSYLRMTSLSGVEDLHLKEEDIIHSFKDIPDLVILVGGSSYLMIDEIKEHWDDIPILLVGETDYIAPEDYTIVGVADRSIPREKLSDRAKTDNISLIKAPLFTRECVDLLRSITPSIENIIFIGGENYQSREQQIVLEDYLKENYPSLGYEPLLSSEMTTDDLINRIMTIDKNKTGVLFCSWLSHHDYMKNIVSRHSILHIIQEYAPIVSIPWVNLENNTSVVGFFTYQYNDYANVLKERIMDILLNGTQPRNLPFTTVDANARPIINDPAIKKFGINYNILPKESVIEYAQPSFWEKYKYWVWFYFLFSIACILVISTYYYYRLSTTRSKANDALKKVTEQLKAANDDAMQAREEAMKLKEDAEKASAMKSLFLQNMSHDIRTPLNAIVGFAQLLGLPDGFLEEGEKEKFTTYITNNSNVLMMLVDDILNMSDVESGKYNISIKPGQCNELCRQTLKSVEYRVQPGVDLTFTTDTEESYLLETDERRVQQILTNFLTNACKHTTNGEINLDCSVNKDPDYVLFSVTDTGDGVPPEKAEKIFERFTKLNAYVEGAGIGLNICTTLAEKLGAKVSLDQDYKDGARFILAVPKK